MTFREKRFGLLQGIGCLACRQMGYLQPSDMHHLLSGTHRIGDRHTIPLCPYHHRGFWNDRFKSLRLAKTLLGPSLALEPRRFHEVFGSDEELLAKANELICVEPPDPTQTNQR